MQQFQVKRSNFAQHRLVNASEHAAINNGEVLVRVEHFAFTANNITYAVAGDMIGYWKFFPPLGDDAEGWGVIPVWGFAIVVQSETEGVNPGDRLFGYWPPANTVCLKPVKVNSKSFIDASEHRAELPAGYNVYRFADKSGNSDQRTDRERSLLFPLYLTGFLIWDQLQENKWYAAEQVIVLSASSKTSLGLAYAIAADNNALPSIGISSAGNIGFVSSLTVYDNTSTYDAIESLDASVPTVIVDMAGNNAVMGRLHKHFGDNMKFTVNVGLTHWGSAAPNADIISERSEFFFAPGRMQKRIKDWGAANFEAQLHEFFTASAAQSRSWLSIKEVSGLAGLESVYDAVCSGSANPREGIIVTL